jgi:competence protein ComEC
VQRWRNPVLFPLLAMGSGMAAAQRLAIPDLEALLYSGLFSLLALAAFRWGHRLSRLAALFFALFFFGAWLANLHRLPPAPRLDAQPGEVVLVEGCIDDLPVATPERLEFVLALESDARARVTVYERPGIPLPQLHYGQRIEIAARFREPRNFGNPGAFDWRRYLALRRIYWLASVRSAEDVRPLAGSCGSAVKAQLLAVRSAGLRRIDQLFAASGFAPLLRAMLLGEDSQLEREYADLYRKIGVYHALVISGLHITMLAAAVLLFLRLCWLPAPWARALTAALAWIFAFICGGEAPVLRAALGFTLFAIAAWFYRTGRLLNLVALGALLMLSWNPHELFDPGFQLSVLSVGAIAAFGVPLLERSTAPYARAMKRLDNHNYDLHLEPQLAQARVECRLLIEIVSLAGRISQSTLERMASWILRILHAVWEAALISLVIQVCLALPMVLYFHRLAFSSLLANLAVTPLLSLAVPVGFAAILTGSPLAVRITSGLLRLAESLARWHISWEPDWRMPDPPLWLALAFVLSLVFLYFALSHSRRWLGLSAGALTCALTLLIAVPAEEKHTGWAELAFLDVGQGDSILVTAPSGERMLVDAGGIPRFRGMAHSRLDIGEDVVSPYLWRRGIRRLQVLALSHLDQDHAGGAPAMIGNFRPREIWLPVAAGPIYERIRQVAETYGARIHCLQQGSVRTLGVMRLTALAPPSALPAAWSDNNRSLVLELQYGERRALLTGDIERATEIALRFEGLLRPAEVLKVPHHGSKTSSSYPFLEVVRPAFAVISAGKDNLYRHPHPEVVERLQEFHATILRTDQFGAVILRTDGRRWELDTYSWSSRQ